MAEVPHVRIRFKRRNNILWFNVHANQENTFTKRMLEFLGMPRLLWEPSGPRTLGPSNGLSEHIQQQCIAKMKTNVCKQVWPYEKHTFDDLRRIVCTKKRAQLSLHTYKTYCANLQALVAHVQPI